MRKILAFFKKEVDPEKQTYDIGEFAAAHPDLLIIVADPKDDTIFVAHNRKFAHGRIKTAEGKKARIIEDMLANTPRFKSRIDSFLFALADIFQFKRLSHGVNNFLQYIDGAVYNISMKHREKVAAGAPEDGAVKSPLSVADVVGPGPFRNNE